MVRVRVRVVRARVRAVRAGVRAVWVGTGMAMYALPRKLACPPEMPAPASTW